MHGKPSGAYKGLRALQKIGRVAGPIASGASGYRIGTEGYEAYEKAGGGGEGVAMAIAEGGRATASELAGWGGAWLGAKGGASALGTLGAFGGPWGAAIGGGIGLVGGGIAGYFGGSKAVEAFIDWLR